MDFFRIFLLIACRTPYSKTRWIPSEPTPPISLVCIVCIISQSMRMEYGFHAAVRLQIPFTIFRYFIAPGSQIYRFHKITSSELP